MSIGLHHLQVLSSQQQTAKSQKPIAQQYGTISALYTMKHLRETEKDGKDLWSNRIFT